MAKRKVIKADEHDLVSWYRRFRFVRAGETAAIKLRIRRRERHDSKRELRRGYE